MVYFWSLLSNIYTMYISIINHTDYHSHLLASLINILIHHHLSTHKYHPALEDRSLSGVPSLSRLPLAGLRQSHQERSSLSRLRQQTVALTSDL